MNKNFEEEIFQIEDLFSPQFLEKKENNLDDKFLLLENLKIKFYNETIKELYKKKEAENSQPSKNSPIKNFIEEQEIITAIGTERDADEKYINIINKNASNISLPSTNPNSANVSKIFTKTNNQNLHFKKSTPNIKINSNLFLNKCKSFATSNNKQILKKDVNPKIDKKFPILSRISTSSDKSRASPEHKFSRNITHVDSEFTAPSKNFKSLNNLIKKFSCIKKDFSTKRISKSNTAKNVINIIDNFNLMPLDINEENKFQDKKLELRDSKEKLSSLQFSDRQAFLSSAYDSLNNHENVNLKDLLGTYAKKFLAQEEKSIDDAINKKPDANVILKSISDLKIKVDVFNVYDKYRSRYTGLKNFDVPTNSLNRIKYLFKI
jgi:hypothetical protein